MERLRSFLQKIIFRPKTTCLSTKLQDENKWRWRLRLDRTDNQDYPRARISVVKEIASRTKRGGGELIPIRAAVLLDYSRMDGAIGMLDLKTEEGIDVSSELIIPTGTMGVVIDVDDDFPDCPYFVIIWNDRKKTQCFLPTVSFIPGEGYEELDFSFIHSEPSDIGKGVEEFVKNIWDERRRIWS